MRILIATDAFPPTSGGSGWSSYELAKGLRTNGHDITIVRTYSERDPTPVDYDGFAVNGFPAFAPPIPFVRNYVRNERLYQRLSSHLAEIIKRQSIDVIHGQHVLTGPASVMAGRRAGIPSLCTVRDYWPVCYWGDLLANPALGTISPRCSANEMMQCLRPRTGIAWPVALAAIPYMSANLRHKQTSLADADAIVAVSDYVKTALRERGPALQHARIQTIPNGVDVRGVRAEANATERPIPGPYALFVGKLAKNKGAHALVDIAERAHLSMPLVVVGDGPERESITARAKAGRCDIRIQGWRDRREVFQWLRHAELLVFPSVWPEPLSRVLIEASALSVPIAAVNTGGTADIVADNETGLLSPSIETLAEDVARLASDATLRRRLGDAGGARAATHFDLPVIVERMETLYNDLLTRRRTQHAIA